MPIQRPRPASEALPSVTVYLNPDPNHWPHVPRGESPGKFLGHPFGITKFDRDGRAVWPMDQFTQRRIRDGDVTLEAPKKVVEKAPARAKAESKT